MAELTPMMRQYMEEKEKHPDSLLFFRLGDFYEMFGPDARTASRELDLALTTRDKDKSKSDEERIPMCGVPYHSAEGYIARLIAKGYKVSICEQMEDPALAKGLVKREIIRTVTPGTVLDEACLDAGRSNYLCGVYLTDTAAGLCAADISTGQAQVTAFTGAQRLTGLINELGRFAPAEAVMNAAAYDDPVLTAALEERFSCRRERLAEGRFDVSDAEKKVRLQFGEAALRDLPRNESAPLLALGGLLTYLYETQKTDVKQLDKLEWYRTGQFMELDLTARRNLELTETLRGKEKKGSLLWVLDKTKTSMGRRLLRSSIEQPLLSVNAINRRLNAVTELTRNSILISELAAALDGVYDLERLMTRVVYGNPPVKDMIALGATTARLPAIKELLGEVQCALLREIEQNIDPLEDVARLIGSAIDPDSDIPLKEGGVIREGYDKQLDEARHLSKDIRGILAEIEEREKDATGIRTLRIGYNRVFGYYIEVSNSFKDQVPAHYIRKQTLTNAERYITEEIKELEERVLHAQQEAIDRASELYEQVRATVAAELPRIQQTAAAVAGLDMLCGLATVALNNNYCCPTVDLSDEIEISEGRHPVVEQLLDGVPFVPNDTKLNNRENQIAVLTGPNMAGKSTYMRQVALIVLMAQVGSFVPAASARIGIVDGIYTRVGASDDLTTGQSTFMVEMSEVANILKEATEKSLLILDEIGRGTSTYDGMSIARAVIEYIADRKKLGAKTLFATHYHELTELEELIPCVKNYNVAVKKRGEDIVFLRRIIPGGVDESYGIEVSKLAGIPRWVIDRAYEVLSSLEDGQTVSEAKVKTRAKPKEESEQLYFIDEKAEAIKKRLRGADPNTLTPIEALNLIYELKKLL